MRAKPRFRIHHDEQLVDLLLQMIEERLYLGTLVASMPYMRYVLEICFGQAVVSIVA